MVSQDIVCLYGVPGVPEVAIRFEVIEQDEFVLHGVHELGIHGFHEFVVHGAYDFVI